MNGINSKSSASRTSKTNKSNIRSIETAGSLAMNNRNPFAGIFSTPVYDMFSSSNPFAVDYSQYSEGDSSFIACNDGGFWGGFYSAFSSVSDFGGCSNGGFTGGDCGGCASSCSSGGGCFTSVC